MKRTVIGLSAAAALAVSGTVTPMRAAAPTTRTIYFSVVDSKGVPMPGLTAADVTVKENGKDYAVEKVEPASGQIQLGIVVDDNGTGAFRGATGALVQGLFGKAEFEIVTVLQQVRRLTEFTGDGEKLKAVLSGPALGQRPGATDGNYLADGILDVGKDLEKRGAKRPAIVVLSASAADKSNAQSGDVLKQLKTTMATLYVVSLSSSMVTNADSANVDSNRALDDGPKQSGGKRLNVQSIAEVAGAVKAVADQLAGQYVLTYTVPDGVKINEKLQVQVKKSGATVMAPTKINDK